MWSPKCKVIHDRLAFILVDKAVAVDDIKGLDSMGEISPSIVITKEIIKDR